MLELKVNAESDRKKITSTVPDKKISISSATQFHLNISKCKFNLTTKKI